MNWFFRFVAELRRRNVVPTVIPYVGLVWLLLQVISVVVPMLNLHPLISTFSAILLFAGFPVVCYLAWHFDFTREGMRPVPEDNTGTVRPFGWTRWSVLMAILIVSSMLGYDYFEQVRVDFAKQDEGVTQLKLANSIAVLPFRDQSSDQDQDFFAKGIAEELTSLLGAIPELKVSASSSSRILHEKGLDPVAIGRSLSVDTVLTGSVRLSGDKLKVRTELIDTSNAHTLWTESFTRKFSDIFEVEAEIGRSIVNLLQDRYLEAGSLLNSANTNSTDAYVMYLKGREQYRLQTTEGMKEARKYFEQAVGLDPEYANAYVALADTILMLEESNVRFGVLASDIAVRLSDEALNKAIVREPELAEAYAVMGQKLDVESKTDEALAAYDKSISLNPNLATAYLFKFANLYLQGRLEESQIALDRAIELDPFSVTARMNKGFVLSQLGKFAEAKTLFEALIVDFPDSPMGHTGLADAAFIAGQIALSRQHWEKAMSISPDNNNYRQNYLNTLIYLNDIDALKVATKGTSHKTNILIMEGRFKEMFKEIDFQVAAHPDDPWILFEAGWYQMLYGDTREGADMMRKVEPMFPEQDLYAMPFCSPAIEIAWALGNTEPARSQAMISRCFEALNAERENGSVDSALSYLAARIAALRKSPDNAATELTQAIEGGWREYWSPNDPLLTSLQHGEINKLLTSITQLLEEETLKSRRLSSAPQQQSEANQPQ